MFEFRFTLPARSATPAWGLPAVGGNFSKHHILGRKYIQLLFALAQETGVSKGLIKRFAGWPINKKSRTPADPELVGRFFWSPYNLFIGPDAAHRGFDPSSGVEQSCPAGFDPDRWVALKAIPEYFDQIGVKLTDLVKLQDGQSMVITANQEKKAIKDDLTRMIKSVTDTARSDKVDVHGFYEDEWVAIKDSISLERHIIREQSAEGVYAFAHENKLIVDSTWNDVITQNLSHKFILRPAEL